MHAAPPAACRGAGPPSAKWGQGVALHPERTCPSGAMVVVRSMSRAPVPLSPRAVPAVKPLLRSPLSTAPQGRRSGPAHMPARITMRVEGRIGGNHGISEQRHRRPPDTVPRSRHASPVCQACPGKGILPEHPQQRPSIRVANGPVRARRDRGSARPGDAGEAHFRLLVRDRRLEVVAVCGTGPASEPAAPGVNTATASVPGDTAHSSPPIPRPS